MTGRRLSGVVARHVAVQAAGQGVAVATGLAMAFVLSRHLGVDGFGGFNYLFAFTYLFLSLNDLGTATIVVREIAREPERSDALVSTLLSFRIVLSLGTMVAAWVAALALALPPGLAASLALFMLVLPISALRAPGVIFQSRLRIGRAVAAEVFTRVTGLALVLVAAWNGAGLFGVTGALVAAEAGGTLVAWRLWRPLVAARWRFERDTCARMLRASVPLGASILLVSLVNRVDFLMLERMAGLDQVGLYGAAYKVTGLAERFPQLVMITLYPVMARAARDDVEGLRRLYRRTVLGFAVVALPLTLAILWASPWLLRLLFGAEFVAAAPGLRVLVWSTACLYVALAGGHLLIAAGWERVSLGAWLIATLLNIGLNLLWIPRWGFVGAAAATTCTYAWITVVTLVASEAALKHLARSGGELRAATRSWPDRSDLSPDLTP